MTGAVHGHHFHRSDDRVFRVERSAGPGLREAEENEMSWIYLLAGALAMGLFVYLFIALFWPEKF